MVAHGPPARGDGAAAREWRSGGGRVVLRWRAQAVRLARARSRLRVHRSGGCPVVQLQRRLGAHRAVGASRRAAGPDPRADRLVLPGAEPGRDRLRPHIPGGGALLRRRPQRPGGERHHPARRWPGHLQPFGGGPGALRPARLPGNRPRGGDRDPRRADRGGRPRHGTRAVPPRVTAARLLAELLARVHADFELGPEMEASFPVGGVDGTLDERFGGEAAKRRVRAKTGRIAGALSLAGYAANRDGREFAFAFLANQPRGSIEAVHRAIDRV